MRRAYTSNPNLTFLDRFAGYYFSSKKKNQFRVGIDFFRLMPKEAFRHILEADAWFGAEFDPQQLDDRNAIGLTVKKRHSPSVFDTDNELDRTEFYWSRDGEIKTLEIEELSRTKYIFDAYYLNKYVHSERDMNQQVIRHFDGSVKVYLQDKYAARLSSHLPREPRSFKKIKLFRIDGGVDAGEWIELISHFYKGNEMIIEYFNPRQYDALFGERIKEYNRRREAM